MRSSVQVKRADDSFAIGTYGNLVIMVWRGDATPERLRDATAVVERYGNDTGEPIGVISIIERGAPPPDAESVKELGREHRRLADSLWAVTFVLEGLDTEEALEASLAIDAVRGPVPFPQRYCADEREAVAWLAARDPRGPSDARVRQQLLDAVEQLRAAIG